MNILTITFNKTNFPTDFLDKAEEFLKVIYWEYESDDLIVVKFVSYEGKESLFNKDSKMVKNLAFRSGVQYFKF